MAQSLAKVLLHIVFSTKDRHPFLVERSVREEMHAYIGGTCKKLHSPVLTVGGVADHIHVLCQLSRTLSIAELVGDLKRNSSKWVKANGNDFANFSWQGGYGAFSVSESDVRRVREYIENQMDHHRVKTFQEEFRDTLKEHGVDFDERFVWD